MTPLAFVLFLAVGSVALLAAFALTHDVGCTCSRCRSRP
jgi:hypothetical protein